MIKKLENASWEENDLTGVTINKKVNTYQAAKNPVFLFPDPQKNYKLTIDLKDISSDSLINISIFLSQLSKLAPSPGISNELEIFSPLLILQNSTSFKFNKIFSGITDFFEHMPEAEIHYHHTGVQFPCAAQKGLGTLKSMQQLKPHQQLVSPSDPLQQLTDKVEKLTLKVPSELPSPKFSEITFNKDKEREVQENFTNYPTKFLQSVVKYEEITTLKKRWEKFGEEWPPLGVIEAKQIEEVYIDDFDGFSERLDLNTIVVLEVSGLLNDSKQTKKIIDLCWRTRSIKCVRIRNSLCSFPNLEGFFQAEEDKAGALLHKDRIRFLDIETALEADACPVDLPCYLRNKKQETFLDFLIWESPFSPVNDSFTLNLKENHQLFSIFLEYLGILQSKEYLELLQ